jgi:hypothetical protein
MESIVQFYVAEGPWRNAGVQHHSDVRAAETTKPCDVNSPQQRHTTDHINHLAVNHELTNG